jgi:ankyrin repeat protein
MDELMHHIREVCSSDNSDDLIQSLNDFENQALGCACLAGSVDCVKKLLERKSQTKSESEGLLYMLMIKSNNKNKKTKEKRKEIIKLLVEHGYSLEELVGNSFKEFYYKDDYYDYKLLFRELPLYLQEYNIDLYNCCDSEGNTLLHMETISFGNGGSINYLLKKGSNPLKKNNKGLSAIHYVTEDFSYNLIKKHEYKQLITPFLSKKFKALPKDIIRSSKEYYV